MRNLDGMKDQEILRLHSLGLSYRDIGESVDCGKSTVGIFINKCRDRGITYDLVKDMDADEVECLIKSDQRVLLQDYNSFDWDSIYEKLAANKHLNLRYIWEESIRAKNKISYSYFCELYRKWKKEKIKDITMIQHRDPGKELFVDWIGDKIKCVYDDDKHEFVEAHFFVTTLGVSSYPFVEAFPDESQISWILGHKHALEWYGGVPLILVPDNCKTAIIQADLYEPTLNNTYASFAKFYNMAIMPARVRKPRDKGAVESAVGWLETWLLEWIKGKVYHNFSELNADIVSRVNTLVERKFQKRDGTRKSIFESVDKPVLRNLPKDEFIIFETKFVNKLPNNYHIEFDNFYYSVPYQYVSEKVTIHAYPERIEVYSKNKKLIAVHKRSYAGEKYITSKNHMPDKHKISSEIQGYTESDYKEQAAIIGEYTLNLISEIIDRSKIKEKGFKSCLGILTLARKYDAKSVEKACYRAIQLGTYNYTNVKNILKNHQEEQPLPRDIEDNPTPAHENLRTKEWE